MRISRVQLRKGYEFLATSRVPYLYGLILAVKAEL